jgi:hypothetical protein
MNSTGIMIVLQGWGGAMGLDTLLEVPYPVLMIEIQVTVITLIFTWMTPKL